MNPITQNKMESIEELTRYLFNNISLLNMSEVARRLDLNPGSLHKAVRSQKNGNGTDAKIPIRCQAGLQRIKDQLSGIESDVQEKLKNLGMNENDITYQILN